MSEEASRLALLRQAHAFPCPYPFKLILVASEAADAKAAIRRLCHQSLGPDAIEGEQQRPSQGDRYIALTLNVRVPSAQHVLDLYEVFKNVAGVKLLL